MCNSHTHTHPQADISESSRTIEVRKDILHRNESIAEGMRTRLESSGCLTLNVVSGPGAGKTELLQRTMSTLDHRRCAAVTGDLATENDARRLEASGSPARQILTGTMCHLEANMVQDAIADWDYDELDYLFVENVGNLVCPGEFDLGETLRVLVIATTEGEDKPLKYPLLLQSADAVVINKIDVADVLECDLDLLSANIHTVRPGIPIMHVSAKTGEGVAAWLEFLEGHLDNLKDRSKAVHA